MKRLLLALLIISCCASVHAVTIGEAKKLADGVPVSLSHVIATAGWDLEFGLVKIYVQEQNRSAGIAIIVPAEDIEDGDEGMILDLSGTMDTVSGERCINVTSFTRLPGLDMPKPLGVPNVNCQGLDPGGLYIKAWGAAVDTPAPAAGTYPHSFRVAGGSGEFLAVNDEAEGVYDERFLIPAEGQSVTITGALSGGLGESMLHYEREYSIDMLASINDAVGYRGWTQIIDEVGRVTAMYVSGPGIESWQPARYEDGKWILGWTLPTPPPEAPAEYQFMLVEPDRTVIYKGWITGYVSGYQTNLSPAGGATVTGPGPVTLSWTVPAGGPYYSIVFLQRLNPTYQDYGVFEADSDTSFTYTGQLEPGRYWYTVCSFQPDGNFCMSSAEFYYECGPDYPLTIGAAKKLADGLPVRLPRVVVTDGWDIGWGLIKGYVQEQDRSAGIAVIVQAEDIEDGEQGMIVDLLGAMGTDSGERCVYVNSLTRLPGLDVPRPLGIPNLNCQGLNPGGLYIRAWGKALATPAPAAGTYPHSFRVAGASGEFTAANLWAEDVYDERFLIPAEGQSVAITGALSGGLGEKTIYYQPEFEIDALGTWNRIAHYEGWAQIRDVKGCATSMSISCPGIDGWQPMQLEDGLWRATWLLPSGPPLAPIECQFKITEPDRQSIYKGWIAGYMSTYPTNIYPAVGAHVFGQLTFSWALPPTGGPYNSVLYLYRYDPTVYSFGYQEVGSSSSLTFTSPELIPGRYMWSLYIFDESGNALSAGVDTYFYYEM